jgi:hypothetical protein
MMQIFSKISVTSLIRPNFQLSLGSLAAALQSSVYGALTGGAFSVVQSFAATAVVASPAVLAIGSILLAGGVGLFGWKLWKWYNNKGSNTGPGGDDDGDGDDDDNEDQQKPTNENAVIPRVRLIYCSCLWCYSDNLCRRLRSIS